MDRGESFDGEYIWNEGFDTFGWPDVWRIVLGRRGDADLDVFNSWVRRRCPSLVGVNKTTCLINIKV